MLKFEAVTLITAKNPDELTEKCKGFMLSKAKERKANVAVSSVPFYDDIRARIPVSTEKEYGVMFFYFDYILDAKEQGGPKHHPDEAEGASAVRTDTPRKRR